MGKYTLGIDLGTTNTVACTFENSFEFIKYRRGSVLPSVIMYKEGKITVGEPAKQRIVRNPENVITSSKTYMGDFSKEWKIDDKLFTPTDVAAEILKEVKNSAEKYFETEEKIDVVITVPAYFTSSQYDETKKAAETAGLNVLKIVSEPVAAAIAYGFDDNVKNIFVVDLGGGTFDICLLEAESSPTGKRFSTKYAPDGDRHLGGDDFDKVLEEICYSKLRREYALDLSTEKNSGLSKDDYGQACQKIRQKAEQAKIALSDAMETDVDIANLCEKNGSPLNFRCTITRQEFEEASSECFNKIKRIINRFVDSNSIDIKNIDRVIFVGGSAGIPKVRNIVKDCLGQEPYADRDLSKLVAMGAALCAAQTNTLVSTKLVIEDVLSHSLGIEVMNLNGQVYFPLLNKGETYPRTTSKTFYTTNDYQTEVGINVYEGECLDDLNQDYYYGGFELTNIKQGPKGIPIQVKFEINESRQLIVTALDESTGSSKTITIKKGEAPVEINKSQQEDLKKEKRPPKISVTSSGCDDIGAILDSMNMEYEDFTDIEYDCDILFINCLTDDYINPTELREYVEQGGCLYASCYADEIMKKAFPGIFVTDHSGKVHDEDVIVEDSELREIVGERISVSFDTVWAKLYSAKDSICILRSTIEKCLPIMVSLKYGRGRIFFTCFHNSVQASEKEKALLQLLVLRQIGMNSDMTIQETGKTLGIDLDIIKAKLH